MEYVSRREVLPYRKLYEEKLLPAIRKEIKAKGITFQHNLVGSAKRNLVIRHHNKGFDCDYQLQIMKNKQNLDAAELKRIFIDAFNKYKLDEFEYCEDSTSSITIKQIDKSIIVFSYDVVLLRQNDDGNMRIIRQNKKTREYKWETLPNSANQTRKIIAIIKAGLYNELREQYYRKRIDKNAGANYTDRKSFQLLNEAINEIIQKYIISV